MERTPVCGYNSRLVTGGLMSVGILEPPVAKRTDVTVKIDAEVVRLARIVAAYRASTVADYLSEALLPIVQRDLEGEQSKRPRYLASPNPKAKAPAARGRKPKAKEAGVATEGGESGGK